MAKLITVDNFSTPLDAHLARGRLEAEGIAAFVADEHYIWAKWMLSHALGGVKLQVAESNLEQARSILQQHADGLYEEALKNEFSELETEYCPRCGATDIERTPSWSLRILLIAGALLGAIFHIPKNRRRCSKCGYRWKA